MGEREEESQTRTGEEMLSKPGRGQRSPRGRRARSPRATSSCRGGAGGGWGGPTGPAGLSAAHVELANARRYGQNAPKGTSSRVPNTCKGPSST